jgi:transcriptional regulator with XRE-family HTH domain
MGKKRGSGVGDDRGRRRSEIATRLGKVIRQARMDRHESQVSLARRLDLEQTKLSRWELGKLLPALDEIERLEQALILPPGALAVRAGLVEVPHTETERALANDPLITVEGRAALMHFYAQELILSARLNTERAEGRPGAVVADIKPAGRGRGSGRSKAGSAR